MKRVICAIVAGVVLGVAAVGAAPSQGKGKKQSGQEKSQGKSEDSSVAINVVFASTDVTVLRDYYAPRYRNLPPGLQKKVARGGQLPPGWQKKFEPFPVEVERRLPARAGRLPARRDRWARRHLQHSNQRDYRRGCALLTRDGTRVRLAPSIAAGSPAGYDPLPCPSGSRRSWPRSSGSLPFLSNVPLPFRGRQQSSACRLQRRAAVRSRSCRSRIAA